ncbi:MAG TPA: hypothetical protein DCM36_06225 [Xanthomonadaceae bacterium]|nr:hypothetical protein [Xanthomonadaceae bacterium]
MPAMPIQKLADVSTSEAVLLATQVMPAMTVAETMGRTKRLCHVSKPFGSIEVVAMRLGEIVMTTSALFLTVDIGLLLVR